VTKSHIAWHHTGKLASYVPSPIAVGKYFYMISDRGYLSCFHAKTGERTFIEQLGKHHSASPVYAGGHVYLTDDDGTTYVMKGGGTFNVVSRNGLKDECYASPAISHGQIFIRTLGSLYCIGKK
jgi:outer membrane protein assembly factor BamB